MADKKELLKELINEALEKGEIEKAKQLMEMADSIEPVTPKKYCEEKKEQVIANTEEEKTGPLNFLQVLLFVVLPTFIIQYLINPNYKLSAIIGSTIGASITSTTEISSTK